MTATILDGALYAEQIRMEVADAVKERIAAGKKAPGLATVLVGDDPASQSYVRSKHKACQQAGIDSLGYELSADASQGEVERLVRDLNANPAVSGILIQLPLPPGLDEECLLGLISPRKDVDGLHPSNIGWLAQKGRTPLFVPCTPAGVMVLLGKAVPHLSGKTAVILGRSNIVGMPLALLLIRADATVTVCHSRTPDLPEVTRRADVLIAAMGKPEMVRGDWVKPGAVVIDVGINRVNEPDNPKGYRMVGDVAFNEVMEIAGAITPVPRGVGPMTIAMLLKNTLHAADLSDKS